MNRIEIESCLRRAFKSEPPPTGDKLVKLHDGDLDRRQSIRDVFSGQRWWDIEPTLIMEYDDGIYLLEPEGTRYYLPAYLRATLYADPEWIFSEMVIYRLYLPLKRPKEDPVRVKFERFLSLLTSEEKSAVRKFLEYLMEHDPSDAAEDALRTLWHEF